MPTDAKSPEESGTKAREASEAGASVPQTRASGAESATGQALGVQNDENPRIEGTDRGSPNATKQDIKPDYLSDGSGPNPQDQIPAVFSSNGQIEHNTVASPSGPVASSDPNAKTGADIQADANLRALRGSKETRLDDRTVARLGGAELRAIAAKRGYDIPEAGTRATRAAFLDAQDKDERLAKKEDPNTPQGIVSGETKPDWDKD